jgi:hypothetical protein
MLAAIVSALVVLVWPEPEEDELVLERELAPEPPPEPPPEAV